MPAMPAANDFAVLHDAFAQGESEVRTKVFDSVDSIVPAENCEVETVGLYGEPKTFLGEIRDIRNSHPAFFHF
jgi:hypothetical protein